MNSVFNDLNTNEYKTHKNPIGIHFMHLILSLQQPYANMYNTFFTTYCKELAGINFRYLLAAVHTLRVKVYCTLKQASSLLETQWLVRATQMGQYICLLSARFFLPDDAFVLELSVAMTTHPCQHHDNIYEKGHL